jgi:hypothetical protein
VMSRVGLTPLLNITNMAGILIMETDMVKALRNLSPAALIYSRNTGEVTSDIGCHKSICLTINEFLEAF